MKYIDSEKLKAEIEGIIAAVTTKNHPDEFGTVSECIAAAEIEVLNLILEIIGELQQEQPEVDLEKEIEDHAICMPMSEFTHDSEAECFIEWAREEFKYFFELGLKAGKEETK